MPTYTYHCEQCDHEFDQHQSFSDPALITCPVCKEKALYKVYKPAQVVFKGSGYYVTDSKAKSSTLNTGSNGAESTSAESKNGTSEAKSSTTKKDGDSKKKASKKKADSSVKN